MPWLKLDDSMGEHRKTRRLIRNAGLAPFGLHALAMLHASRYLTDGFVDEEYVDETLDSAKITGKRRAALTDALESSGQWERVEGGWQLHDYLEYNPPRVRVEEQRRKDAERKAAGRNGRSADSPAAVHAESSRTDAGQTSESGRPVPSRPVLMEATPPNARKVSYQGRRVSAVVVDGAEHLLAAFNDATNRTIGAWGTDGKPSASCKQIIGAMLARPDVTVEQWDAGIRRTVASPPSFIAGPVQIGHVFGEKAAEWALTEGVRNGAVADVVAEGDRLIAEALDQRKVS